MFVYGKGGAVRAAVVRVFKKRRELSRPLNKINAIKSI